MSPLEDLYPTRTNRDRNGTISDEWNEVLLRRDLERLIDDGLVESVTNIREISSFEREKTWYMEVATGNLYVYVAAWERGAPEFRRQVEPVARNQSNSIQQLLLREYRRLTGSYEEQMQMLRCAQHDNAVGIRSW